MNRAEAWNLVCEWTASDALRRHMLGVEAAMRWYARKLGEDVEAWGVAGLLHDFDYERYPQAPDHPLKGAEVLRAKGCPEPIVRAILGHAAWGGVPRDTPMARALFAVDELVGFLFACSYVQPSKRIADVKPASVKKKFKDKGFARAVSREDIQQGIAELGLDAEEHIANVIAALTEAAPALGLAGSPAEAPAAGSGASNAASAAAASTLRIAMWSGPRNISTALMRSFENRTDCAVCDEPFYAWYLKRTSVPHPMAEEVIAAGETDPRKVVEFLTGPVPGGKAVFYQKHMAHHLLPDLGDGWIPDLTHAFLIRDPREVLLSLDEKFSHPRIEDTGYPQQLAIFEAERRRTGRTPPVVDSRDVLENPRGVLGRLSEALGIAFEERMLSWPPGRRPTDGIWARHWYNRVEETTGFKPPRPPRTDPLPSHLDGLHAHCRECYDALYAQRLRA